MPTVRRSLSAERDYDDIWNYIAADNPDAADRLLRIIDSKLQLYAENPRMGRSRDEVALGVRSFPVGNYLVFYRIVDGGIELARVIHGARDLKNISEF